MIYNSFLPYKQVNSEIIKLVKIKLLNLCTLIIIIYRHEKAWYSTVTTKTSMF